METRKHPETDINKQSPLYLALGLVMACGLILMAFEWRAFTETVKEMLFIPEQNEMVREEIINYVPPPPQQTAYVPPPPTVVEVIRLVEDVEDVETEIEFEAETVEIIEHSAPGTTGFGDATESTTDEIFMVVEDMPRFKGCENAKTPQEADACFQRELAKFLQRELVYPPAAKQAGQQGKVYVYFVVDKDGSVTDVKAVRDFGYGSGVAAENVIKKLPKFTPGKQRGRPVKVQYTLPINFTLRGN